MSKSTDFEILEKIFEGAMHEEDLSDHMSKKLERIRSIHAMLMNFHATSKIVKKIKKLYGVADSQVFRDISITEALFGGIRKSNKEYNRMRSEQMALATYRIALKAKDTRGMAAANRNFNEATGINIQDPDLPDFNKLEPVPVIVTIPDEILAAMAEKLMQGPIKYQSSPKPIEIQDPESFTDFESVTDAD